MDLSNIRVLEAHPALTTMAAQPPKGTRRPDGELRQPVVSDEFRLVFRRMVSGMPACILERDAIEVYFDVLRHMPIGAVKVAAQALLQEPRKFFPTVGEWYYLAVQSQRASRIDTLSAQLNEARIEC